MSKESDEVQEAIDLVATVFKYIQDLHYRISILDKAYQAKLAIIELTKNLEKRKILQEELDKETDLHKSLVLAKIIGRAERKANRPIHKILKAFDKIDDTNIKRIARQVKIPSKLLLRGASSYFGTLSKHLRKLNKQVKLDAIYPRQSRETKIQLELNDLKTDVEELETSAAGLEAGLRNLNRSKQPAFMGSEMTRRGSFKPIAAVAFGALALFSNPLSALGKTISKDKIIAGKLYFYIVDKCIDRKKLERIQDQVVKNYSYVGIIFEKYEVTEDFPLLESLDILMLAVSKGINRKANGDTLGGTNYGRFTIVDSEGRNTYTFLKKHLKFPYDEMVAKAHLGMIDVTSTPSKSISCAKNYMEQLKKNPTIKPKKEWTKDQLSPNDPEYFLRLLEPHSKYSDNFLEIVDTSRVIRTFTHEVAHGLGAAHLVSGGTTIIRGRNWMAYNNCQVLYTFHRENIRKMRAFIAIAQGKSDEEIIKLRYDFLTAYVNTVDEEIHNH
jgi:hypothetical protein